jgi:hypothetical protein
MGLPIKSFEHDVLSHGQESHSYNKLLNEKIAKIEALINDKNLNL